MTVTYSVNVYDAALEMDTPLGVTPTESDAREIAEEQCDKLVSALDEQGLGPASYEADGWRYLVWSARADDEATEAAFVVEIFELDEDDEDDNLEE